MLKTAEDANKPNSQNPERQRKQKAKIHKFSECLITQNKTKLTKKTLAKQTNQPNKTKQTSHTLNLSKRFGYTSKIPSEKNQDEHRKGLLIYSGKTISIYLHLITDTSR